MRKALPQPDGFRYNCFIIFSDVLRAKKLPSFKDFATRWITRWTFRMNRKHPANYQVSWDAELANVWRGRRATKNMRIVKGLKFTFSCLVIWNSKFAYIRQHIDMRNDVSGHRQQRKHFHHNLAALTRSTPILAFSYYLYIDFTLRSSTTADAISSNIRNSDR